MTHFVFRPTTLLTGVAMTVLLFACSKEPVAPSTPLVEQRAADPIVAPTDEFRGTFAPGGVKATYRATFSEGQIHTLEETREANSRTGIYEFRGARMIKYHGSALGSDDTIDLEFDVRGKLLAARAGDKDVSAEEINAISDRAQSLRSHAVAQRAVQGHDRD